MVQIRQERATARNSHPTSPQGEASPPPWPRQQPRPVSQCISDIFVPFRVTRLTSEKGLKRPPGNASVISLGTPQNEPTLPTAASSFFLAFSLAAPVERALGETREQVTVLVSRSTMATSGGRSLKARERDRLGMPMSQGPGSCASQLSLMSG